ncbi:hypothetical protein RASY3_14545 [Ruminococcus albus SY3]|uniref:Uncharacterized protein n=1 Tax=Ruminococcus albus SY3 TaxID=1341156 RepID=A0A011VVF3_RUMAL|nr:hypothetical protein [Ruminococcus albus]EXM38538.1 hypothetical protein RASY3_14545 [Ruminococcus albus SY3]
MEKTIDVTNINELKKIKKGIIFAPNMELGQILIEAMISPENKDDYVSHLKSRINQKGGFALRIDEDKRCYGRGACYLSNRSTTYADYQFYRINYAPKTEMLQGHLVHKVGDFIKIIDNLEKFKKYDGTCLCTSEMFENRGKSYVIKDVQPTYSVDSPVYLLQDDTWCWSLSMIDDVVYINYLKPIMIPISENLVKDEEV